MDTDPETQRPALGPIATRLLYEDERVRVWDQLIEPGESTGPHHHALPYALVTVEGAPLDVLPVDGYPMLHGAEKLSVDLEDLPTYLGRRRFHVQAHEGPRRPGVATGLAWTPVGGDVLTIEASTLPGKGGLVLTGQLGDVMKESGRAALTYVLAHGPELGLEGGLGDRDVHIHVPAGAVPKDGPSAGVTMFTALASLLSDRAVRSDVSMTGEATLRGRVLPVGGIKAKVLAAHRRGLKRIILPKANEADLEDVPLETREELEFVLVEEMSEVLEAALDALSLGFAEDVVRVDRGLDMACLPAAVRLEGVFLCHEAVLEYRSLDESGVLDACVVRLVRP